MNKFWIMLFAVLLATFPTYAQTDDIGDAPAPEFIAAKTSAFAPLANAEEEAATVAAEISSDDVLCSLVEDEFGEPKFHKGKCEDPYYYKETCEFSDQWVSKCECKPEFSTYCDAPFVGVGNDCEGKFRSCCDTTCPSGKTYTLCDGNDVRIEVSRSECGDVCFGCRKCTENCTIRCRDDQETVATRERSECGTLCVRCIDKRPVSKKEYKVPQLKAQDIFAPEHLHPSVPKTTAIVTFPNERTCEVQKCSFSSPKQEKGWTCTECLAVRSDCSTYMGWECSKSKN